MRRILTTLTAVLVIGLALGASGADARSCDSYGNTTQGATIEVDAYYGATCSFGRATASRLYAAQGVPRSLTVLGTRLTRRATRHTDGSTYWLYDGTRHGRYASVIVTEMPAPAAPAAPVVPPTPATPTDPTVLPPGNGYPVVCADGSVSTSGGIQGACSHHGGVA
ncbi:MAG: hypothetical protein QOF76_382 [Solirubrobacteraceae bacterium]|jgi:hypothetical protein|nr:hypothetical protein [Solirubrobacteraceae bacterium]